MSSHKSILFFTENVKSNDTEKLVDIIKSNFKPTVSVMDIQKYIYNNTDIIHHIKYADDTYYGIENLKKKYKKYKIIADIHEQIDYNNPNSFTKDTIDTFEFISKLLGSNNLYVAVHSSSEDKLIKVKNIFNNWKGNLI